LGIGDWGLGIGPNPQSPIPISSEDIINIKYKLINILSISNISNKFKLIYEYIFKNKCNNTHQKKTSNAVRLTQNKSSSSVISNVDLTNIEASEESLKPYTKYNKFFYF